RKGAPLVCAEIGRRPCNPDSRARSARAHQRVEPPVSKDAVNTATADVRPAQGQVPADAGDAGYSKDLKARHINMIAIGGAIGTGLFLGAGGRLRDAGPALALAYLVAGVFAFFVVRALGELVLYRPSSGSFVS